MRILHLDTGREMRGGQYQAQMLYDALANLGCDQTLLGGPALRGSRTSHEASALGVRRHARTCDLIHAHDARAHTLALLHGRRKPVVVSRRVAFPPRSSFPSRWKYSQPAHFIAVSQHVASVLVDADVSRERISVIPDAAPPLPADASARPRVADSGVFRAMAPNLSDPLKGRDLAVSACKLAGVDLAFSAQLQHDLRSADVFLYLSRSEGFGSAILLAMTFGLATVASRVGGIPEAVDEGKTGLLVDNDPEAIADALVRLRDDPLLRSRMGEAARKRASMEFGIDSVAKRTLMLYEHVLAGREPSGTR